MRHPRRGNSKKPHDEARRIVVARRKFARTTRRRYGQDMRPVNREMATAAGSGELAQPYSK